MNRGRHTPRDLAVGSTIAAGMAAGLKPKLAAEFSFLLAIPPSAAQ
jgi:undecaprenyl pyrophosphate phosphatase UppP